MSFTALDYLKQKIGACPAGNAVGVSYDLFRELFPPGEPDERARKAAYNFAKVNGCTINISWSKEMVFFVKPT